MLTQANAAQAQEGSLNVEREIPPAQEGEAAPHSSREEGGPLTPPGKGATPTARSGKGDSGRLRTSAAENSGGKRFPQPHEMGEHASLRDGRPLPVLVPLTPHCVQFPSGYNPPPELEEMLDPRLPPCRVKGVAKLLGQDGSTQYFLFALQRGTRARAWWKEQREMGGGSAYAQTWSPTGGHTSSRSWEEFCEQVRQEENRAERERLESLRW